MSLSRYQSFFDYLLPMAALLALETQLRDDSAILGPGEVMLLAWIGLFLFIEFHRLRLPLPKVAGELASFWLAFAISLCLGFVVSIVSGEVIDFQTEAHDVISYCLMAAICILLALDRGAAPRLVRLHWFAVIVGALLMVAQLANAADLFAIPGIDPWYWDRLRAWTENPNQLALFCLLVGLMALHLYDIEPRLRNKSAAFLCGLIVLGGGFFAKSNAYLISVISGLVFFALAKFARLLVRLDAPRFPIVAIFAMVLSATAYAAILSVSMNGAQGFTAVAAAAGAAREGSREFDEAAVRLMLWREALARGTDAWMLGVGPGPHLEIPEVILSGRRNSDEPTNLQHPIAGIAPNFEAHNTYLELYVQGGIVALGAFVWLFGLAALRAWRAHMDGLMALLLAMGVFFIFHVMIRHPLVWLILCGALTAPPRQRALAVALRLRGAAGAPTQAFARQRILASVSARR